MVRFPFSSKRKIISSILENVAEANPGYNKRLHIKGASEIIKNSCTHYLDEKGKVSVMTDTIKLNLDTIIHDYAK